MRVPFTCQLPNLRSTLAMLALVGGAALYVLNDASFVVTGYIWVAIWYAIFCFDQLCTRTTDGSRTHDGTRSARPR